MKRILVALMLIASTGAVFAQSSATYLKLRVVDSIRLGDQNVRKFSTDVSMADSATDVLPTQSAVKGAIATRLNISDTSDMLKNYLRAGELPAFSSLYTQDDGLHGNRILSGMDIYSLTFKNLTDFSATAGKVAAMRLSGQDSAISFSTWGESPNVNRDIFIKRGKVSIGRIGDNVSGINDSLWNVIDVGITSPSAGVLDTGLLIKRDRTASNSSKSYKITFENQLDYHAAGRPAIWAEGPNGSFPSLFLQAGSGVSIVPALPNGGANLNFRPANNPYNTPYASINASTTGTTFSASGSRLELSTNKNAGNEILLNTNRMVLASVGKNIELTGYYNSNEDSVLTTTYSGKLIFTDRNTTNRALIVPHVATGTSAVVSRAWAIYRFTNSNSTVTLPAANTCNGVVYELTNYNSGGDISISPVEVFGTETTTIPNNTTWRIQSDGIKWILVSRSN